MEKIAKCLNCNNLFVFKYTNRNKVCSSKCRNERISTVRQKYSQEVQLKIVELKKQGITNKEIVKLTGCTLFKIKEVCKRLGIFLDPIKRAENAKRGRLAANPRAYEEMREKVQKKIKSKKYKKQVKEQVEEKGFLLVGGLTLKGKPFRIKCEKCNKERQISTVNVLKKGKCKGCSNTGFSSDQEEIARFIESLGFKIETKKLGRKEIDIFIPSESLGIEYCGLYWHNENSPTPRLRSYHFSKMKEMNQINQRLITIFEDEWINKKDQVKSFLISLLKKNGSKLYARKLKVEEINPSEAFQLCDKFHIQGKPKSSILRVGIKNGDEIIGCMIFGIHHRKGSSKTCVLNRLVFKSDVSVAGGSSKMLSFAIKKLKELGYSSVVSWSDNRWSEGGVYRSLGFRLEAELGPDYSYCFGGKKYRLSKQSCTKKALKAKGATGDTESEMAASLGYSKIWDCGKKRWVYDIH